MKFVVDKFDSIDAKNAGAVVFWASPVAIRGKLVFEDHQAARIGDGLNKTLHGIVKERCEVITVAGGWTTYSDFTLIHSPSWPQDPTKNMFILQSNWGATGVDAECMRQSMSQLLTMNLLDQITGRVMVSWPSVMDATGPALRWLELTIPPDWYVYTPDRYITEDEGIATLAKATERWKEVWPNPSVTASGLRYQYEVAKAYDENLLSGMTVEAALQSAWHIARNEVQRRHD